MSVPYKLNLKVYQGSTFREVLRYESSIKAYKPITGITKTAPIVINAPAHGMPNGWRTTVAGVSGMKEINSTDYYIVSEATEDTVTFNSVNAINFNTYTTGGVLEYNVPVDITGYTGRMQVRAKLKDDLVLLELTTETGGIIIDATLKTITIFISATIATNLSFTSGIYSLELVRGTEVIPFVSGSISVIQEVTR